MATEKPKVAAEQVAAAQVFPTSAGELIDLSNTVVRTKAMNGEEGVMRHRGFSFQCSILGSGLLEQAGRSTPGGQARTPFVEVSKVGGSLDNVGLRPSVLETPSSLPVRWDAEGRANINLSKLLMVRPFPIPKGQRAHVPVDLEHLVGVGLCLVLRFPKATFETIETRKKNNDTSTTTSTTTPSASPSPAATEKKVQ
ncbi:MAG TPA: hypothetical protein VNT75_11500 [Symbiobacteriaceae bacterium]|nr:hypothetical protein [Symbiobacteriaceae bacterium]